MNWWFRSKPKPPEIPPFAIKPLVPKDPDYVVSEEEMTQTGMWRLFPFKKPKE